MASKCCWSCIRTTLDAETPMRSKPGIFMTFAATLGTCLLGSCPGAGAQQIEATMFGRFHGNRTIEEGSDVA
jgi:hypothetical protein